MTPCLAHTSRSWPGPITVDSRGRLRVFLGLGHPAANSGGWQWAPRFLVWEATGERLRKDEHAHHRCGVLWCCNPEHLAVSLAEMHGRYHALYTCLRDGLGRFREIDEPHTSSAPRLGPIIGRAALEAR